VIGGDFEVELALSGMTLTVPPDTSILDVVNEAGVEVLHSCLEGTCGTCETPVLAGQSTTGTHSTPEEQAANESMFIFVSRAACPKLSCSNSDASAGGGSIGTRVSDGSAKPTGPTAHLRYVSWLSGTHPLCIQYGRKQPSTTVLHR
jgi:ferredoxin